ncbi:hypothetical protein DAEQUDRAFT_450072 [Daedalea quercina L-15889]|uniref:Secreted protein n=1 Tax=Daedalea quercina L-15889 TaxID=1314783 RepID=A0A165N6T1_9APHY|nr:hypothetical protein DAEQUDRAFT_450072 [Daedalea quercina L-15889]
MSCFASMFWILCIMRVVDAAAMFGGSALGICRSALLQGRPLNCKAKTMLPRPRKPGHLRECCPRHWRTPDPHPRADVLDATASTCTLIAPHRQHSISLL